MNATFGTAIFAPMLLGGCHRQIQQFGWVEWAVIGGFGLFVAAIFGIDVWMEHAGYRVEPAPYVGLGEAASLQERIQSEADKQHEHAGKNADPR